MTKSPLAIDLERIKKVYILTLIDLQIILKSFDRNRYVIMVRCAAKPKLSAIA